MWYDLYEVFYIQGQEKFDVNDIFEIYREKSCFVYSLYSNLDKLLAS